MRGFVELTHGLGDDTKAEAHQFLQDTVNQAAEYSGPDSALTLFTAIAAQTVEMAGGFLLAPFSLASLAEDTLRIGEGIQKGTVEGVAQDVGRALVIYELASGGAKGLA